MASPRMPPPFGRDGDRAYFTDQGGTRWRVYDVGFGPPHAAPGKRRVYPLESPRANYRWFVSAEGVQRCYAFGRGESRALTAAALARQFAAAGYVSTRPFDPSGQAPR